MNRGQTTVTLDRVDVLEPKQHITIGQGTDVYAITKKNLDDKTIDITPGALVDNIPAGAAVELTIPTAAKLEKGQTHVILNNVEALDRGKTPS